MPIIMKWGKLRVRIHYGDHLSRHLHVEYGNKERTAKIRFGEQWVILANHGFSERDITAIIKRLKAYEGFLHEEWERIIEDEK